MPKKVFLTKIRSILSFIFGKIQYTPPGFVTAAAEKWHDHMVKAVRKEAETETESQPPETNKKRGRKRILITILIVLGVITAGGIGYLLVRQKAETVYTTIRVRPPRPTPLRPHAQVNPLRLEFSRSAAPITMIDQTITAGIELKPEIEGTWKWEGDSTLVFMPGGDWPAGTEFSYTIVKELVSPSTILRSMKGSFKTEEFSPSIANLDFHIDPTDPDLKQVTATVRFSHPVNPQSLENNIELTVDQMSKDETSFTQKAYGFTINYDEFFGTAYILSEALPIPDEDVTMKLKLRSGIESSLKGGGSRKELTRTVTVPGLTSFISIRSVRQTTLRREDYSLEQLLVVETKGDTSPEALAGHMEAWVLPKDKPEVPGMKAIKNMRWNDPAVVGPEDLKAGKRIQLEPKPTEREYVSLNSFGMKEAVGSYVYVRIKKGMPFYGGYSLSKEYTGILQIGSYPKLLQIMQEGILLSSRGEQKVSVISQGISGVYIRVARVLNNQVQHLISQSNGVLTNFQFNNYQFNEHNISEIFTEKRELSNAAPEDPNYFSIDVGHYLKSGAGGQKGLFLIELSEWNPASGSIHSSREQRLLIVSDLGLLVKDEQRGSHQVFVQSVASGRPVTNARVEIIGKNGLPVLSAFTDTDGHCEFPSFAGLRNEKSPVAYLVQDMNDLTFLPVTGRGRYLDYSDFDTSGVHGLSDPKELNAYLFSDRGIYRPGDKVNIGAVIKTADWTSSFSGTPMELTVTDPRGVEIASRAFAARSHGFEEYSFTTADTSPTGTYQVNLHKMRNDRRDRVLGSVTLKVEEFIPDKLLINADLGVSGNTGWVQPKDLKGQVTLRNLAGFAASGNKIKASLSLSPGTMWFRKYRDYLFNDPLASGKSYNEELPDALTDSEGRAEFNLGLNRFDAATYFVRFMADGFEKDSGRSVHAESRVLVSPLEYLVGIKPNGDLSYINRNTERKVSLIAIDPELKQIAKDRLDYEITRIDHVSVLTKQPNGTYDYESVEKESPHARGTLTIPQKGLEWSIPTDTPGDYRFALKNQSGETLGKFSYSIIGQENVTRSLDKTAELEIKLNKTDFDPGEEIEVFIKAPYTGSGLITIEKEKVYAYTWFSAQSTASVQKIRVPKELEGNGYVNVSFIRDVGSRAVFMSPLSYGVAPFSVSKDNRMIPVSLSVPDISRSGTSLKVDYETQQPAKLLLFAVDEGILQVSKYSTPDPLSHFFKKHALEVRTSQILDLILPEFSVLESMAAMGGGAGFDAIAKNLNPFKRKREKPVVFWSGIMDTDGTPGTWNIDVPDYFDGTLRIMSLAVSADRIGVTETPAVVRNPFVLSPNVPLFATPGDSFQISLLVTNVKDASGEKLPVEVSLRTSSHFTVEQAIQKAEIDERSDANFNFTVQAGGVPGSGEMVFTVKGGGETVQRTVGISLRPVVPYRNEVTTGVLRKERDTIQVERTMFEEYRKREFTASRLPLSIAKGLTSWLDDYPYGCSEQIISASFPYLLLRDTNGFGISDTEAGKKVEYVFNVLLSRQNRDGNIGVWAANSTTSDFITIWGMHFVTEAKDRAYPVPPVLLERGLNALTNICREKESSLAALRLQAYAAYILTRNQIITTAYITKIQDGLEKASAEWKTDIAAGYIAASYGLMQDMREGSRIIRDLAKEQKKALDTWDFYSDFLKDAGVLYLTARHFPQVLPDVSARLLEGLAAHISSVPPTTIDASFAILALDAYSGAVSEPAGSAIEIYENMRDKTQNALTLPEGKFPKTDISPEAVSLDLRNRDTSPLYYQVVQAGFDTVPPTKAVNSNLEIGMQIENSKGEKVERAVLGDTLFIRLRLRSLKNETVTNIAVVNLLPAGLELDAAQLRGSTKGSFRPEYIDVREDRLVLYGSAGSSVTDFVFPVNAVNKGSFRIPVQYAEGMYNPDYYSIFPGETFVIE